MRTRAPLGCGTEHAATDPLIGQPLCPDCYDYNGHVLWHAHASKLWDRFVIDVRRRLASSVGLVQSGFADHARLSFARVAEYQKRAAVHVHAVIRLDGPDGPTDEPPAWGTTDRLTDAVRASAGRVLVRTPYSPSVGEIVFRWGAQLDVRPLHADSAGSGDDAVAAYVAKYVTKGASETGAGTDHKVTTRADIDTAPVSEHVRTLMRTCWRLGGLPEYASLRLRTWIHSLGYRGHILTKSRAYSTTYAALRANALSTSVIPRSLARSPIRTGATSLRPHPWCRAHRGRSGRGRGHQSSGGGRILSAGRWCCLSTARREPSKAEREQAAVRAWINRQLRDSPPLSDDQLRSVGEILGLRLIRRSATRA